MSGDLSLSMSLLCFVIICCFMTLMSERVVSKATRECGYCMANVGIRCYAIFQETFSKWTCKFIY